eukprot:CAMPEP_0170577240 /NCGR_PEP_ID=MMETSP0224-20130122/4820_1 /TAXON_ID=285029 /ORGANISM="Togula jolla, Strain CCCM 725" /LENGTH=291 /DNA_ID=CAMNT_0010900135 /DNA_START=59 /DNA_END=933 /DNA_ORIENTATION=-
MSWKPTNVKGETTEEVAGANISEASYGADDEAFSRDFPVTHPDGAVHWECHIIGASREAFFYLPIEIPHVWSSGLAIPDLELLEGGALGALGQPAFALLRAAFAPNLEVVLLIVRDVNDSIPEDVHVLREGNVGLVDVDDGEAFVLALEHRLVREDRHGYQAAGDKLRLREGAKLKEGCCRILRSVHSQPTPQVFEVPILTTDTVHQGPHDPLILALNKPLVIDIELWDVVPHKECGRHSFVDVKPSPAVLVRVVNVVFGEFGCRLKECNTCHAKDGDEEGTTRHLTLSSV